MLARIFKGQHFSAIHSFVYFTFVYFTFSVLADVPSIDSDASVWIDGRVQAEGAPRALLSELHNRWDECLGSKFGRRIQRVDGEKILGELKRNAGRCRLAKMAEFRERQPGERAKAFAAFRLYGEMEEQWSYRHCFKEQH